MKYFTLIVSIMGLASRCYAQKPLVNDTTYLNWTTVEDGNISPNGKYVFYRIANEPKGGSTWVIQAADKSWKYRSTKISRLAFSSDCKYLYAMQSDSLVQLKLSTSEIVGIPNCTSYELYSKDKTNWLIYTLNDVAKSTVIENLRTGKKQTLTNINEYSLNRKGASIVSKLASEAGRLETLQWTDLNTGVSLIIYKGTPSNNIIYDISGNRMAFDALNEKGQTEIQYYQRGWKNTQLIATDTSVGIAKNLKISTNQIWRFSADGQDLFFNLAVMNKGKRAEKDKIDPDIWNYKDLYLLSELKKRGNYWHNNDNLTQLNISSGKVRQILSGYQHPYGASFSQENVDVFIVQDGLLTEEFLWENIGQISYYLCFSKTGQLVPIKKNIVKPIWGMSLSPDNNFLLYFDPELMKYVSYNVKNGKSEIISQNLEKELYTVPLAARPYPKSPEGTYGIIGWIAGTNKVIVHGMYDLWELDLENRTPPRNITNMTGENNQLIFGGLNEKNLEKNKSWLLRAFSMPTKEEEIYTLNYNSGKLTSLFKAPSPLGGSVIAPIENIKKADQVSAYLIKLGNARVSPNYVYTTDFKKLDTLSNNYPEKKYNWLSADLANYTDRFGRECQGIVYKPENFDPKKKYPVIFYYYLEIANELNKLPDIGPSNNGLSIPILVSNGYIVCMPNIYLDVNKPGESALTSINAAANYLKQFTWIDSTKMGIMGHSRGGYETDYIVTHSNRFTAAVSGAGMSNLVEYYNNLNEGAGTLNHGYVRAVMIMKDALEDNPQIYNDNSPILATKNVSTPLLLMHNEEDHSVSVSHSKELFVQLRSQQKPIWLLQYETEGHTVETLKNQLDFQNKVKDFFDHYLKGIPMPAWMNNPIK